VTRDVESLQVKANHFMRGVVIEVVLLLVVFLLGFVPMWLKSRASASRLVKAERHLNLAQVQNALAAAAVDVH
jgi:hypothetical protein